MAEAFFPLATPDVSEPRPAGRVPTPSSRRGAINQRVSQGTDPNMRCVCGYRQFHERRTKTTETVLRWMLFDDSSGGGGFGATPFGTYYGAGSGGEWGQFSGTLRTTRQDVICESCQRVRSSRALGGIAAFGSYIQGNHYYVAASDVAQPVTCFSLRFDGPGGTAHSATLEYYPDVPPAIIAPDPGVTSPTPPAGASIVNTLLRAALPEIYVTGDYTVVLVDQCAGVEIPLATISLEEAPMIIAPNQAHVGAFPELWLRQSLNRPAQHASGSGQGIPLEYCEAVLEYEAHMGSLPDSQGWAHQAGGGGGTPSNWALVEGGALRGGTPGGGNPSYWEKTATLSAPPTEVHMQASYLWESDAPTPAPGEGLDFQGLYAASAAAYRGLRWTHRDGLLYTTSLDTLSESVWARGEYDPNGWHRIGGSLDSGENQVILNGQVDTGLTFGTGTVAAADEIKARFGDVVGSGVVGFVRSFVVSTPGRFIRPWFVAAAPTISPVLRFYLVSDVSALPTKTARFMIRYGKATGDPYAIPASSLGGTINFTSANTVYELTFNLSSLTANQPFWFTIERDWTHTDDVIDSTVWLRQATVRSS